MFRVSTGEDWNCIMHDCMDESKGGSRFAWVFFLSFVMLVSFITLNLFIAVILDNFSQISDHEEEDASISNGVNDEMLDEFRKAWSHYDPKATRFIPSTDLLSLLRRLKPPLGLGRKAQPVDLFRLVKKIAIPSRVMVHSDSLSPVVIPDAMRQPRQQ